MISINEIIEFHLQRRSLVHSDWGIRVVTDFDPQMPKIHPDISKEMLDSYPLFGMLRELSGEQTDTRARDESMTVLRYSTLFDGNLQYITIDHNGKLIPVETLDELNRQLREIHKNRETVNPRGRGGNKRAAIKISELGGRIYLENYQAGDYHVGTTIEIPVGEHTL
ncbi:hypothetical protein HYU13_05660 [Candidatus Woesearchaeota archaeon]|nr:hypothetical protein [Candidatus Woesearchaeota archaeon]